MLAYIRNAVRKLFAFLRPNKLRKTTVPKSAPAKENGSVCRIRLLVSPLKVYKRRTKEVRCVYVNDFCDAYRFLVRMCDTRLMTSVRRCSHTRYTVVLPADAGRLELTDKCRHSDRRTVAELLVDVPALQDTVNKIIFMSNIK